MIWYINTLYASYNTLLVTLVSQVKVCIKPIKSYFKLTQVTAAAPASTQHQKQKHEKKLDEKKTKPIFRTSQFIQCTSSPTMSMALVGAGGPGRRYQYIIQSCTF